MDQETDLRTRSAIKQSSIIGRETRDDRNGGQRETANNEMR